MMGTAKKPPLLGLLLAAIFAAGGFMAPEAVTAIIRNNVRDSILPGQQLIAATVERTDGFVQRIRSSDDATEESTDGESQSDDSSANNSQTEQQHRLQLRRLQLINAELLQRLQRKEQVGASPYRGDVTAPLFLDELLHVTVFGEELSFQQHGAAFVDQGRFSGVKKSDLVLQSSFRKKTSQTSDAETDGTETDDAKFKKPLIDHGTDFRLETGYPVFFGRAVFGRISQVGRWTSRVQRVTDREYRGHAQIVRKDSDKTFRFGAKGVLEGTGKSLCRLTLIRPDVPVDVGDDVYTTSDSATFPFPMYYGKIVRAELPPGATHWEIDVAPAIGSLQPKTLDVLRKRLNQKRFQ